MKFNLYEIWKQEERRASDEPFLPVSGLVQVYKGLGAIRVTIGPTSDVDNISSKMYSQYVLFRNKYS
jgi:glucokinase